MKKCTVCRIVKKDELFGSYKRDPCRCNACHTRIKDERNAEILANKEARIKAYNSGEMLKSSRREPVYSGKKIEIENKLLEIQLAKELEDYE